MKFLNRPWIMVWLWVVIIALAATAYYALGMRGRWLADPAARRRSG